MERVQPSLHNFGHFQWGLVWPVQFFIAYRMGHDLVSNKVGSFSTADIFRSETFFDIRSEAGSGSPDAVRSKRFANSMSSNFACNAWCMHESFSSAWCMIADVPPTLASENGAFVQHKNVQQSPQAALCWGPARLHAFTGNSVHDDCAARMRHVPCNRASQKKKPGKHCYPAGGTHTWHIDIHVIMVQVNAKMVQLMTEARQSLAGELDGKFPSALRNLLFGNFGEDLFTRNAFRSLEVGMQPYVNLANCFGETPDPNVRA
jgi:hypothetical protein